MNIEVASSTASLFGQVEEAYAPVVHALEQAISEYELNGFGLSVFHKGKMVIDLTQGYTNRQSTQPWQKQTLVNAFSTGKAIVAIAVLQLIDRGLLDLDDPIAKHWPEFGIFGKEVITVRQVLSHRSGMSAFHSKVKDDAIFDWNKVTQLIQFDRPWWEPGTEQGYSPILYGWILGELVCRVSGASSFSGYIDENINKVLGTALKFGLEESDFPGVADVRAWKKGPAQNDGRLIRAMQKDAKGVVNQGFTNPNSLMVGTNQESWRRACIPAANGHFNALDLAVVYNDLIANDSKLLSAQARALCFNEQSFADDQVLQYPLSISCGFFRMEKDGEPASKGRRVCCHPGMGGCIGYADADNELALGFTTSQLGVAILMDVRVKAILHELYKVIEV